MKFIVHSLFLLLATLALQASHNHAAHATASIFDFLHSGWIFEELKDAQNNALTYQEKVVNKKTGDFIRDLKTGNVKETGRTLGFDGKKAWRPEHILNLK